MAVANFARAIQDGQRIRANNALLDRQESANRDDEVMRAAAQAAVNPQTGRYDMHAHMAALEQAGYPEAAHKVRAESLDRLSKVHDYMGRVLPMVDASNYAQAREGLLEAGMPEAMLPAKFDPAWLRETHRKLGVDISENFGEYETIRKTPRGGDMVGQKNLDTGEYENVRELDPYAPQRPLLGRGGGGGMGGEPAEVRTAKAFAEALGVSVGDYLMWKKGSRGKSQQQIYTELYSAALKSPLVMGDSDRAEEIARAGVEDISAFSAEVGDAGGFPGGAPAPAPPAGMPAAAPAGRGPLAQHEGKIITQGGRRFQVVNGQPVPLR